MANVATTGKRPASQWYWADWLRAPEIRGISLEARGFWMDLLAIMHEGEPYGHLTISGNPIDDKTLGRMVGATPAKVRKLVAELEAHKVFSRTDLGVIYSRRMVRDEHIRNIRRDAGKLGGNPNLIVGDKDKPEVNQPVEPEVNQTHKQNPTPSSSASASASAASSTSTAKTPRDLSKSGDRLVEPRARFIDRFYAAASPERRADIARQIAQTLEPEGAILRRGVYVTASSPEHLNRCISHVLRSSPPADPDKAIVFLLNALLDPELDHRRRTPLEAISDQNKDNDKLLDRWNLARQRHIETWSRNHPDELQEIQNRVRGEVPDTSSMSYRGTMLIELMKASHFPEFEAWSKRQKVPA